MNINQSKYGNEEFEDLDTSSNEEEEIKPHSRVQTKDVKIVPQQVTVSNIIKRLDYGEIDLSPNFQRNSDLWSPRDMSGLIESILLKIPLPVFYFDVSDPDKWLVIDGLQRLSTIKKFILSEGRERLALRNLEFLTDLNGKFFDELDRPLQRIIEETQLMTYQIEPQTPKIIRYSIFRRINTGGLKLNRQEIRQAINQSGYAASFLKNEVSSREFKENVSISSNRMLDRELVLRFCSFKLLGFNEDFTTLADFLDRGMEELDKYSKDSEKLEILSQDFRKVLSFCKEIFGENHNFSRNHIIQSGQSKKRSVNRSLFDTLTVNLSVVVDKESFLNSKEFFVRNLRNELKSDNSILTKSISDGTSSKTAVENRMRKVAELIDSSIKE